MLQIRKAGDLTLSIHLNESEQFHCCDAVKSEIIKTNKGTAP